MSTLYYSDNLAVLREHIRDKSLDLIYLDPPFNSNAGYEAASQPTIENRFRPFPRAAIRDAGGTVHGSKPKLPPLVSPVKKASRVETRASHQKGAQGALL